MGYGNRSHNMKSIEEIAKENQERWDALNEKHRREHKKFMDEFNMKMEKLDRDLEHSRSLSRNLIEKIVVLATSIVGFSVTILSVDQLNINLSMSELMVSWILFASTIAFGLLIPFIESRVKYVIYWRGLQPQEFEEKGESVITLRQRSNVFFVTMYSIFINPRSLIYCSPEKDEKKHLLDKLRNAVVIHQANLYVNLIFILEFAFVATFIFGFVYFIASVQ